MPEGQAVCVWFSDLPESFLEVPGANLETLWKIGFMDSLFH